MYRKVSRMTVFVTQKQFKENGYRFGKVAITNAHRVPGKNVLCTLP